MSRLRSTLRDSSRRADLDGPSAYYALLGEVDASPGLLHGKLDGPHGGHCAIGWYFADHLGGTLSAAFIDEVATINDSVPSYTPKQRKAFVARWLRWKLTQAGFPGFRTKRNPLEG